LKKEPTPTIVYTAQLADFPGPIEYWNQFLSSPYAEKFLQDSPDLERYRDVFLGGMAAGVDFFANNNDLDIELTERHAELRKVVWDEFMKLHGLPLYRRG
jgi:hypothetical protein